MNTGKEYRTAWLDKPLLLLNKSISVELVLFSTIIAVAIASRFIGLGDRALSHDESVHIYYSYLFSLGKGYFHTPLSHGPLQFHLIAFLFSLMGSSDFLGRVPHALASIVTILMLWNWRDYLGRAGTIIAAFIALISPYMLYYGRYARNEAFVALFGVLTLYAMLRYFETGKNRYLFLLTIATVLHFASKETAFIYTAQALVYLAVYFIFTTARIPWKRKKFTPWCLTFLSIGMLLGLITIFLSFYHQELLYLDIENTSSPVIPGQDLPTQANDVMGGNNYLGIIKTGAGISCALALLIAAAFLFVGYGWEYIKRNRAFDMLVLLGTFVLPQLTAFPVSWLGWNPLDYHFAWSGWDLKAIITQTPVKTGITFVLLSLISIIVGILWDKKRWIPLALVFWGIYSVLFTAFFTNPPGFFTGSIGSLGYWLEQQAVRRGNQPWFYYLFLQIPFYEFLPALGIIPAMYFGYKRLLRKAKEKLSIKDLEIISESPHGHIPIFSLLVWWTFSGLFAYTLAGEKMPWLTVHIILPMILLTGWGLGKIYDRIHWDRIRISQVIMMTILFIAVVGMIGCVLGLHPPFQGKSQEELMTTGVFLTWLLVGFACCIGIHKTTHGWERSDLSGLTTISLFCLMALITGRISVRASFLNSGNATEYLVYAHGASGIKGALSQIDKISKRISGGYNELALAFDAGGETQGVSWPWKWYTRNYPKAVPYYTPDKTFIDADVIVADPQSYNDITALADDNYYYIDTLRMVWPNQDYFNLSWNTIKELLADQQYRNAVFQIWLNRDYSLYGLVTNKTNLDIQHWSPADGIRLYIRKSAAAKLWEYNLLQQRNLVEDPYAQGEVQVPSDLKIGSSGSGKGQFFSPHGIAVAPDGSLYIVDTGNNRIQHFSSEGEFINMWGNFSDSSDAPIGTFNLPSAIAVSPDGKWIYITDTWNHRIQKFSFGGDPVLEWGYGSYHVSLGDPFGLWGPRGIAVDQEGRVYVADTGNKRIVVFDSDGNFLSQFGGPGNGIGQLDEPVGIAIDAQGYVYVADTWNRRIQVFAPSEDKNSWEPYAQWTVAGWFSDSEENKPLLALDDTGHIFVGDPDLGRVLEFTTGGAFVQTWNEAEAIDLHPGIISGIAVDDYGNIWVCDTKNNLVFRFNLP